MSAKNLLSNIGKIVFMGDSITKMWKQFRPDFFSDTNLINKGVGGEVTKQMLLRFRKDVIELQPAMVIILAGINDIAQNDGYISIEDTAGNIKSMGELADYHDIKVVLCSVLPAIDFPWSPGLNPAPKVVKLNAIVHEFARVKGFSYVDYYSAMVDEQGGLCVPD